MFGGNRKKQTKKKSERKHKDCWLSMDNVKKGKGFYTPYKTRNTTNVTNNATFSLYTLTSKQKTPTNNQSVKK